MGDSGTKPRVVLNTDTETMDFVRCFGNSEEVELARRRHVDNLAALEDRLESHVSPKPIIPTPLKVELASILDEPRQVHIDHGWTVLYVGPQLRNESSFITGEI